MLAYMCTYVAVTFNSIVSRIYADVAINRNYDDMTFPMKLSLLTGAIRERTVYTTVYSILKLFGGIG